jgi:F-type H+-transporting ATPase subunit b
MTHLMSTPEFWVAVSFLGFVALLLYYKVPGMIGQALDQRAEAIKKELDEARRLRMEAQALLEDYRKKHGTAQQEADAIVAAARREAEAVATETRRSLKEMLERRTKLAEDKIARAEAQALGEVRAAAIEAAVGAAEKLIGAKLDPAASGALIQKGIADLGKKLN